MTMISEELTLTDRREERLVLQAAAAYFGFALLWSSAWRGWTLHHVADPLLAVLRVLVDFAPLLGAVLAGYAVLRLLRPGSVAPRATLRRGLVALLATGLFFAGFTMVKTVMPLIVPFWADPMFTELDRAMHGGRHAYELTHEFAPFIDAGLASHAYVTLWMPLALGFPAFVMLSDPDPARRARYLGLYALVWIGLGNVLALAFLSGGPIYADALTGTAEFAGLDAAMASSGLNDTFTVRIHDMLWQAHVTGQSSVGSGISAFPSVHVGIATLLAVYALERRGGAVAVAAVVYAGIILFLSAYLGWHYLVDGYASILVVVAGWALSRRAVRDRNGLGDRTIAAMAQVE